MKTFLPLVGGVLLLALSGALATAPFFSDVENPIENEYIVVFHSNTTVHQQEEVIHLVEKLGGVVLHRYSLALKGFASRMEEKIVSLLLENSVVKFVERNGKVGVDECVTLTEGVPWGLSRITHEGARNVDAYTYSDENGGDGDGVVVYVIDTGILCDHQEFEGRAVFGFSSIEGETTDDCNGHGTHVAGTIGGKSVGVARKVTLVAVKVLGCEGSGSNAGVIEGIDYAAINCKERKRNRCVGNMSLGGGKSEASNSAVAGAVDSGVIMAVAAGNENKNACKKSPASTPEAITVGAAEERTIGTQNSDFRAPYSNFGDCVDIFAPGSSIFSSYINVEGYPENAVYATLSGTSMACPHVAGVAAQLLANQGDNPIPASDFLGLMTSQADNGSINFDCESLSLAGKAETCTQSPNKMLQSLSCSA